MISIDDLPALMDRLRGLDLAEVQQRLLQQQGEQLGATVRQVLSDGPGGEHLAPWLQTGKLRDSISHQSDASNLTVGSDDPVAVDQELGTRSVMPRPFLVPAAAASIDDMVDAIGAAVADALAER